MLQPRKPVPSLEVITTGGQYWKLKDQQPENFTMIVFYRGYHCPICKLYLSELTKRKEQFQQRGVSVIALSTDSLDRAHLSKNEWELNGLPIGYGLKEDVAREWGLPLSSGRGKTSIGIEEPAIFNEPGVFLVRPDGTLYAASVQTMPFARPNFKEILSAIDFVVKNDYPARGEL